MLTYTSILLYVQKYKTLDVIDAGELNVCIQSLETLYEQTKNIVTILSGKKSLIDFAIKINKFRI